MYILGTSNILMVRIEFVAMRKLTLMKVIVTSNNSILSHIFE